MRYDMWSTLQIIAPLAGGLLGMALLWRRPQPLGKVVLAYALLCIAVALSPLWVQEVLEPSDAIPEVLLEAKLAFVVGLAMLLATGGRSGSTG